MLCCCFLAIAWSKRISNQTDIHQIFRVGRHVAVDVQFGIGFAIGQGTLLWQPIIGAKSAEIGDTPSFLGLTFHNGWHDGKADGRINSAEVLSTSFRNFVNFGPLTPELRVMVWRPFMRQMREIGEMRSFVFGNGWQEPLNGYAPNSFGRCA